MRKIFLIAVLGSSILLSGCAAGMFGGGHHSNNNQRQEQRSIEQVKADGAISSRVKARFANDVTLKKISVSTYRGVVTLYGAVPTRSDMERAIQLSSSLKGVVKVRSGLRLR